MKTGNVLRRVYGVTAALIGVLFFFIIVGVFALEKGTSDFRPFDSVSAASRVIEIAEQVPAPSRAPVGEDAEEMLRFVREKSDAEQDALRLQIVGLS